MTPLKPERWKTLLAFLYVLLVSWVTAFVMVIVHDRVPDMEKYPPLPDIILDNVPHIPWVSLIPMCKPAWNLRSLDIFILHSYCFGFTNFSRCLFLLHLHPSFILRAYELQLVREKTSRKIRETKAV